MNARLRALAREGADDAPCPQTGTQSLTSDTSYLIPKTLNCRYTGKTI